MAKYEVRFSCGHTHTVELFGKDADRQRKIAYYEEYGVCPDCYREEKEAEKSEGCKEVEMSYSEYKREYSNCNTKANSYNKATKTIIVYVPIETEETAEEKAINEILRISGKEKTERFVEQAKKMLNSSIECLEKEYEKVKATGNEKNIEVIGKVIEVIRDYKNQ